MPQIGLGTYPFDDDEAQRAVMAALELGYRHVDTSYFYGNEVGVGRGLAASGIPREEIFVTSKFDGEWHGVKEAREAFEMATDKLGVEYLDLFLIHWPLPWLDRYVDAFKGLVALLEAGDVRAIGTSNFNQIHLDRVIEATGVVPDVNQINLNPSLTRDVLRAYHREHGIVTESWSPLDRGGALLSAPIVLEISERHGRSPAQILLRWQVELGLVAVPRTSDPRELAEDLAVFDFSLTAAEVSALSALDRGEAAAPDVNKLGH